jgi:hypothetical protein
VKIVLSWRPCVRFFLFGSSFAALQSSREPPKSVRGRTGEPVDMKKVSGKLSSKPSGVGSYSFMDELSESQQLQKRLYAIVKELETTVGMLEQNLQKARSSAHLRHEAKGGARRKSDLAWQTSKQ